MRLTDLTIRALKAPERGQKIYFDDQLEGFGLRVSQGGAKTFVVMYGRQRRLKKIGRYPILALAEARQEAKTFLAEYTLGKHRGPRITFDKAVAEFRRQYLDVHNVPQTALDTERRLKNHISPKVGGTAVSDIRRHDLASIFGRLIERKLPGAANHAFAATRLFFNWARDQGYVEHSPIEGMRAPAPHGQRDRVLSHAELKIIWKAAEAEEGAFARIVQLLLLSPQRRKETSALMGEWIDQKDKVIVFPKTITKNRREHVVPYGQMFQTVLDRTGVGNGYLFPAVGSDSHFSGWSKGKQDFEKKCRLNEQWQLHDFRRTIDTNMAELGVPPHVVERLLNHISTEGAIRGVAAIYNRYSYLKEMREAAELWESRLASVTAA